MPARKKSSSGRKSSGRKSSGAKKSGGRKYSQKASQEVRTEMRHFKQKKHGNRVKSRKQAIAIGLSKARRKGAKVPRKKAA